MIRKPLTDIFRRKLGLYLIAFSFMASCQPPKADISIASLNLRFSTDTIFFDTLLSSVASVTKRLRVYNDESKAIIIANINITNTSNAFSITVNGIEGLGFEQTHLLAGDSLLILLKANLKEQNQDLPYVVEEQLSFSTNGGEQIIPVIAWGQDAHFLRDSIIMCNTVWQAGKPYVIYDNVLIDSLCSLTIQPGTKIYSHFGSTIFVKGTLNVQGSAHAPVLFTNDRFDSGFDTAPGQWGGIVFLEGSTSSHMNFAHIKNAKNGIWLGAPDTDTIPDLELTNSIIENISGSGILSFTSDLTLSNCLVNNCGEINVACLAGGNYTFVHNTFANFGFGFFRTQPIMVLTNNLQLSDGSVILDDLKANLENNIIWGDQMDELVLVNSNNNLFDVIFNKNLIRTSDTQFEATNILNQDPLFVEPSAFNYRIDSLSPAINRGNNLGFTIDLDSLKRDNIPDIGAYEWRQN